MTLPKFPLLFALLASNFAATAEPLAPKVVPLDQELIGFLLERGNLAKADVNILCRALEGDQLTLRAMAATELGAKGDPQAVPFLVDALADESSHVGANYLDPGDATTRHRANKALKKLTGKDFGFVWNDPKEKRETAIAQWQEWYRTQSAPAGKASDTPGRPR